MSQQLHQKFFHLQNLLRSYRRVLVAFSGGCDSTFLVAAALQTLPRAEVLAVCAESESLATSEKRGVEELACRLRAPFRWIQTREMKNPLYVENNARRCFYCKDELFSHLGPVAEAERRVLVDGFNASDRGDYRPGQEAASQHDVQHPLEKADLFKKEIRILSRWLALPTWNKPASPCLSSRIPYGTPVTPEALRQIEAAEAFLRAQGFRELRVRHYGDQARIEVPLADLPRLRSPDLWERTVAALHDLGFQRIVWDPRGFKSGRLNEAIRK